VLEPGHDDSRTITYLERHIKFLLWAFGGFRIYLSGPDAYTVPIATAYTTSGARQFDVDLMADKVYDKTFECIRCAPEEVPAANTTSAAIGGHLDGCRIGFDLGASDYKLAAVIDGEAVFSTEIPWHPVIESDYNYHYNLIVDGLKQAASHLPRVDAIGGSSAGIYINNQVMVASLFRAVPETDFNTHVRTMFERIQNEWNVPLEIINDGDVTALAGAMSLEKQSLLGVAMGSSEAVGYINGQGALTSSLNELAFAPVDFNADAAVDEWSGDYGVGALYFSQQAVNKLAPAAGFSFAEDMLLPERLKIIQGKANDGDDNAQEIFRTIGSYLGYTLPWYNSFYDIENILVLGRVVSGTGGDLISSTPTKRLNNTTQHSQRKLPCTSLTKKVVAWDRPSQQPAYPHSHRRPEYDIS
jgi:predicted NBD/HSP70 family sugar kinase